MGLHLNQNGTVLLKLSCGGNSTEIIQNTSSLGRNNLNMVRPQNEDRIEIHNEIAKIMESQSNSQYGKNCWYIKIKG